MSALKLDEHRSAIAGHCYRMLGSPADAEDAVQETLVRAWRNADRFDGRSSVRTWLHRIATNVCLDALGDRARRARPMELRGAGTVNDELEVHGREHWIEPIPDAQVVPSDANPAERLMLRQRVRLAFVAALQHLPPRQRAALLLSEVLGFSAAEIAETLEMSLAAVNSALQRARATLSMPPYLLWLQGPAAIRDWLLGRAAGCKGSRLMPTQANGLPAFGQYRRAEDGQGHKAWALLVLELEEDRITGWNAFLDTATFFPRFGLPLTLPSTN